MFLLSWFIPLSGERPLLIYLILEFLINLDSRDLILTTFEKLALPISILIFLLISPVYSYSSLGIIKSSSSLASESATLGALLILFTLIFLAYGLVKNPASGI